jgi:hypothetical protein
LKCIHFDGPEFLTVHLLSRVARLSPCGGKKNYKDSSSAPADAENVHDRLDQNTHCGFVPDSFANRLDD